MAENGKNRLAILTIFCFRRTDVVLTSVRANFKLAPRNGSRREPFLGAKTVKASLREAFTVLVFKIL